MNQQVPDNREALSLTFGSENRANNMTESEEILYHAENTIAYAKISQSRLKSFQEKENAKKEDLWWKTNKMIDILNTEISTLNILPLSDNQRDLDVNI